MRKIIFLVLIFSAMVPASLCARVISLQTQTAVTVRNGKLTVNITATNRGDESADNVEVQVEGDGFSLDSPAYPILRPGEDHTATFTHTLQGALPGRYPLVVRTLYADANQHPFTALSATYYSVGQSVPSAVLGILDQAEVGAGSGRLTLRLKNLANYAVKARVHLYIPSELSSDSGDAEKTIGPAEETNWTFSIRNFAATADSTYPVYAVVEHDHEGLHYTTLAAGMIHVVRGDLIQRYRYFLWFLLLSGVVTLFFLNARIFKTK